MQKPAYFLKVSFILVALIATAGVPSSGAFAALRAATSPSLGTAESFAVLAGTAITNVPTSAITGDVGLSPASGSSYTGLTAAQVTGTIYAVDATGPGGSVSNPALLTTAKTDLGTAYDNLDLGANANANCDPSYTFGSGNKDLAGKTLVPGVYCADTFTLSGILTLDDTGNASGVWVFKSAATLITSAGGVAQVRFLTGIGSSCNVWWRVVSSATIDTGTAFIGNILALTSISLKSGSSLAGRALARNAAVTLESNTISRICAAAPPPPSTPTPTPTATPTTTPPTATPTPTPTPTPPEVPEAGTFLLMASGLGGLATWLGWQRTRRGRTERP